MFFGEPGLKERLLLQIFGGEDSDTEAEQDDKVPLMQKFLSERLVASWFLTRCNKSRPDGQSFAKVNKIITNTTGKVFQGDTCIGCNQRLSSQGGHGGDMSESGLGPNS